MDKKPLIITIIIEIFLIGGLAVWLHEPPLFQGKPTIETSVSALEQIIESDRQPDGKYKRRDVETIDGIDYEVHEYETYKGEIGYMIFITKTDNNKIYKKAIATGVEKKDREYDWKLFKDLPATTTTTTTK